MGRAETPLLSPSGTNVESATVDSVTLCRHCHYRPVRTPPRDGGRPPLYCSPACKEKAAAARCYRAAVEQANRLRQLLGLPGGVGGTIGVGELRRMVAVVAERLEVADLGDHRGRRRTWGEHGTMRRYRQGCHCDACRAAMTAYYRARRQRQTEAV